MKSKINQKENKIIFWLNAKIYLLEAIYSAAYVFLDRAYIYLDGDPKKEIMVSLKGKKKLKKNELNALEGEFRNELLNNILRTKIAENNSKIREYIIGQAIYSSVPSEIEEILDKTGDDYQEDPLDIAIPWEEKKKNSKKLKSKKLKKTKKTSKSKIK